MTTILAVLLMAAEPVATVPFELVENHVYVSVRVQGLESRWILDTGAGATVIDRTLANELGLEAKGEAMAVGASGTAPAAMVEVPGFELGGLEQPAQMMVALDVAALLRSRSGTEIAGIVGADFLGRYVFRVDYANSTLVFYARGDFRYDGPGRPLAMRRKMGVPAVEMTVEDSITGWWRLDLGAAVSAFHKPSVAARGLSGRPGVDLLAGGVGGMRLNRFTRFGSAELAGYRIERPLFMLPLEAAVGALADAEHVGTAGATVLRNYTLTFDYSRDTVYVEPGGDLGHEFPLDRSGLQFELTDSKAIVVLHVADGTPAAEAGLEPGDQLLAVDGMPTEDIGGLVPVRELFRADAGITRHVRVRRGTDELEVVLRLRDLFD